MAKKLAVITKEIASIQRKNKLLKSQIGFTSRDILEWVAEHWDSAVLNKMVNALNGNDKAAMILFFKEFTPFKYDDVNGFGAMSGSKSNKDEKRDKSAQLISDFLADETNDFWTWCEINIKTEKKPVDYAANFKRAAKNAHEKGQMEVSDMLDIMVEAGLTPEQLKAAIAKLTIAK